MCCVAAAHVHHMLERIRQGVSFSEALLAAGLYVCIMLVVTLQIPFLFIGYEHSWWSGVVVSTLALINEVNLRRTRLVLRWVTVSGSIPGAGHLFQYVTNQPPKANSAFHPSSVGK